jgi:PAS domain S-box-containing protein
VILLIPVAESGLICANPLAEDSLKALFQSNLVLDYNAHFNQLFGNLNTDDSLFVNLSRQQIQKASDENNKNLLKNSYWLLANYYFLANNYTKAFSCFQEVFSNSTDPSEKALIHLRCAQIKQNQAYYPEALEYLRQAKITIYKLDFFELETLIQLEESLCYIELKNFTAAESRIKAAEKTMRKIENSNIKAILYSYQGYLYRMKNNDVNAQAYFLKAVELFDNDTLTAAYAFTLQQIGRIYFKQKNTVGALTYWNESLSIYSKINFSPGLAQINLDLAEIETNDNPKTKKHLYAAAKHFKQIENKKGLLLSHIALTNFYTLTKKQDSATRYLLRISSNPLTLSNPELNLRINLAKLRYYMLKNQTDSARIQLKKSILLCENNNNLALKAEANELFSIFYLSISDYKNAYLFHLKAYFYSDSLICQTNSYDLKLLQVELDTKKQQGLIDHLTKERNQQNLTISENIKTLEKQKALLYLVGIILLFILIVSLLLGLFLQQKKRDMRKLAIRNRQIAQQKEEIDVQRQHLVEINQELEKLSIVARETDNGIRIMNEVGRIIWVNEGYVKMHGYTLNELHEIGSFDLLGENANININQLVSVWYGDKNPITFESLVKNKWGNEMWVQTTLTPILDAHEKINKMIAIDSDISRIKKAEQEIMAKNLDITSSISYAKRIQEAMMTPFHILTNIFPESFCFYKPKSIVSGDFYWITFKHDRLIVACADSTGHGVPGAFMSLIGISFLNKIVNEKGFVSPAIILNRLRMNIISHLHQTNGENLAGDGMDMSLISINLKNNYLEFSGAMNPIIIMRKDDLIELKPDRMPVGFFDNEDRPFSSTSLNLQANDQIYMFTDGYYDQFGGESNSKMKGQRFREILKTCAHKPIDQQKNHIEQQFNTWRGNNSQIDDVLLIGIHIN